MRRRASNYRFVAVCAVIGAVAGLSQAAPQPFRPAAEPADPEWRGLHRAGELRGMTVKNMRNDRLGTIRDAAVNLEDGAVVYLAMAAGGFLGVGERLHALPPHVLVASAERRVLILDADVGELRTDHGFDRNEWPEMAHLWQGEITEPAGAERSEDEAGVEDAVVPDHAEPAEERRRVLRAADIIGTTVRNLENQTLGSVKDLVIHLQAGEIVYVVLSHGGLLGIGERLFAIPPAAFQWAPNGRRTLLLDADSERLSQAKGFDPRRWPMAPEEAWHFEPYEFHGQERALEDPAGAAPDPAEPLSDREITQRIRRAVVTDETLSFSAKNVAILAAQGVVTLRGVVRSEEERKNIVEKAKATPGVNEVHEELEIRPRPE